VKKLSFRERRLALVFFSVLFLVLFWQVGVRSLAHRLTVVNRTLEERQKLITRAQTTVTELAKLEQDDKKLATQKQLLVLPNEAVPEMILLVGQAAKAAKVGEVDIRPLPAVVHTGYLRQPIQLQCQAGFLAIKDFLYYLEQGANPLLVERMEISTERDNTKLQATFLVVGLAALPTGEEK
jgi:Tfp pilus assembly protein PilO